MTRKAVIQAVLSGKRPPYVPWALSFTQEAREKRVEHDRSEVLPALTGSHRVDSGEPDVPMRNRASQETSRPLIFNHDGYGILADLAHTPMGERDAADLLVKPLAEAGVTAIDWNLIQNSAHNCRTRQGRLYSAALWQRCAAERPDHFPESMRSVPLVIERYAAQPLDLMDIVIKHGHERGLNVYGGLRLNPSNVDFLVHEMPGRTFGPVQGLRKDFRDETYHAYLLEIFEDLLAKGVDGVSLDFERKAPFFPADASQNERFDACRAFLRKVRKLTSKTLIARVCHDAAKGIPEGQDPEGWLREGLLDAVIPATHNHEPDLLDWGIGRFVRAAKASPRPCAVWPQIWPTPARWEDHLKTRHEPAQVVARARRLFADGADAIYFFNFCCYWPRIRRPSEFQGGQPDSYEAMFRETAQVQERLP